MPTRVFRQFDPMDQEQVEKFLLQHEFKLEQDEEGRHEPRGCWTLSWQYGTVTLDGGDERKGRAMAALFMFLWEQGVDCGLARDLAWSYFDKRVGRLNDRS